MGTSVPTVGADALLYSFTKAAAAPELEQTIPYNEPAEALTLVALVVAALLMVIAVEVAGLLLTVQVPVCEAFTEGIVGPMAVAAR